METQQYPIPTVGLFIFNPQGEVLLVRSHKWKHKFTVPGGKIELGETINQALKREAKEETGLDISSPEFVLLQEFVYDSAFWQKKHFIFLDFACKTKSTRIKLNDEAEEYLWVNPEKAIKLPDLERYAKKTIEKYLQKRG